eukprot:9479482-Pyramimonas_sp.AAC.2
METTADEDGDEEEGTWSQMPMFLVDRVMQLLQWATPASRTFRLVCRHWQLAHDGLLPILRVGSWNPDVQAYDDAWRISCAGRN